MRCRSIVYLVIYSSQRRSAAFSPQRSAPNARTGATIFIYSASDDFALIDEATTGTTRRLSRASPTSSPYDLFTQQQLDLCRAVTNRDACVENYATHRSRFHEHPRCTARFGEVISHSFTMASTMEERMIAVTNAEAVMRYTQRQTADGCSHFVSNALLEDMVQALTSPSIRKFRIRQITDYEEDMKQQRFMSDFIPECNELELLGRLYYSAINAVEPCSNEVGLSVDHTGFTVLLAMCRAAGLRKDDKSGANDLVARLDEAISSHFNAITAPGCRFLYSPCHGLDVTNQNVRRSKRLVIAFSSLGNGLVRFEFGGSLAKLNKQLCNMDKESDTFDVLFVADPSQSWYTKDSKGNFDGYQEYEKRIRIASRPYNHISIVGDSMGGSAALLFSYLATESVVAFSPQVNLNGDEHVSRNDMTTVIRDEFQRKLFENVKRAVADGVKICIHRGLEESDVKHTKELLSHFSSCESDIPIGSSIEVIEHAECVHHQSAVYLKDNGRLISELAVLV
jgi:hypothetical protein